MRIVRYERDWKSGYGIVEDQVIYELVGDVFGECKPGRRVGQWGAVKLLAPCRPETIWSNGANYPSRLAERNFPTPKEPHVLWSPGTMITGPDSEIRIPEFEPRAEYGAELGIVLRKDCHQVKESEARDYILGYTALNNVWIKDADHVAYERPMRVYDTHCPVGPVVDTTLDPRDLFIRLRLNGELRQNDRTSSVLFGCEFLVSYISRLVPMKQGDLIMTGCPGGVEGQVLHFGDVVEVEIEGIGVLRNVVTRVDAGAVTYIVSVQKWLAQRSASGR